MSATTDALKAPAAVLGLGGFVTAAEKADKDTKNAGKKATTGGNDLVIPSAPLGGILGETTIAGASVGLHMTTRGVVGAGYVVLGVGLAIVGLVFVVGGLRETQNLVRTVSRGIVP